MIIDAIDEVNEGTQSRGGDCEEIEGDGEGGYDYMTLYLLDAVPLAFRKIYIDEFSY